MDTSQIFESLVGKTTLAVNWPVTISVSECDMGYGGSRNSGCMMCEFGEYKSAINDIACTSCVGAGFSTNNTASTDSSDCGKSSNLFTLITNRPQLLILK